MYVFSHILILIEFPGLYQIYPHSQIKSGQCIKYTPRFYRKFRHSIKSSAISQCKRSSCITLYYFYPFFQLTPVELLPYLYIGDAGHSTRRELLKRLDITAILNVSTSCENHFPYEFRYKVIPVEDSSSANLLEWFQDAIFFIGELTSSIMICYTFRLTE